MELSTCPECEAQVNDEDLVCPKCGFDLIMYKNEFSRIYNEKLKKLDESSKPQIQQQIIYHTEKSQSQNVHKPRCPYCNSENLTRITSLDKVVNIALFGVLGNKRKYQWHCNNCKTNW